jgi:hypothetical protein
MAFRLHLSMRRTFPPEVIFQFYYDAGQVGCWEWLGTRNEQGYGMFWPVTSRPHVSAHRFQWIRLFGPVPEGKELDHLCSNRACVNPSHLEPVSHRENCRRGDTGGHFARKTHCPQGHPYSGHNLVVERGHRVCRACRNRVRLARYYARKATRANG